MNTIASMACDFNNQSHLADVLQQSIAQNRQQGLARCCRLRDSGQSTLMHDQSSADMCKANAGGAQLTVTGLADSGTAALLPVVTLGVSV